MFKEWHDNHNQKKKKKSFFEIQTLPGITSLPVASRTLTPSGTCRYRTHLEIYLKKNLEATKYYKHSEYKV